MTASFEIIWYPLFRYSSNSFITNCIYSAHALTSSEPGATMTPLLDRHYLVLGQLLKDADHTWDHLGSLPQELASPNSLLITNWWTGASSKKVFINTIMDLKMKRYSLAGLCLQGIFIVAEMLTFVLHTGGSVSISFPSESAVLWLCVPYHLKCRCFF